MTGWPDLLVYLAAASLAGYILLCLLIRPTRAGDPLAFLCVSAATGLAVHAVASFIFNQWFGIPLTPKTVVLIAVILLLSVGLAAWLARRFLPSLSLLAAYIRALRTEFILLRSRPFRWRLFFWVFWGTVITYCTTVVLAPVQGVDAFFYHLPFSHTIYATGFLPKTVSLGVSEFENAYPPLPYIMIASTWLMLGYESAKAALFLSSFFGISCALLVRRLAQLAWRERSDGWAAATLFLAYPSVLILLSTENVDFLPALFTGCALWYLLVGAARRRFMRPVAIGLFAALAAWCKYHYFALPVLLIVTLAAVALLRRFLVRTEPRLRMNWLNVVLIVAVFCILLAPFVIRNYVQFGNPVYPLFPRHFHGVNADEWWILHTGTASQFIGYPWKNIDWGFLVFALQSLPFIFLVPAISRAVKRGLRSESVAALLFGGLYFLLWLRYFNVYGSGDQVRFLLPTLMVVAAFAAPVFADFILTPVVNPNEAAVTLAAFSAVVIGWVLSYKLFIWLPFSEFFFHLADWNPFYTFAVLGRFWFVLLIIPLILIAFASAAAYEKRKKEELAGAQELGGASAVVRYASSALILAVAFAPLVRHASLNVGYVAARASAGDVEMGMPLNWMNANLPPNAVLFTGENEVYLIPRECVPFSSSAARPVWDAAAVSWDRTLGELKRLGITHVCTSSFGAALPPDFDFKFTQRVMADEEHFTLLYRGRNRYQVEVLIYRVNYPATSSSSQPSLGAAATRGRAPGR